MFSFQENTAKTEVPLTNHSKKAQSGKDKHSLGICIDRELYGNQAGEELDYNRIEWSRACDTLYGGGSSSNGFDT